MVLPRSYEKVNYVVRPSKQVERKLFVEALSRLSAVGYDIRSYTYLGMGSPYYADFILFHKYLHIKHMICVEGTNIPKRMRFNRPYGFIKLEMRMMSAVIPGLNRKKRYVAWLDYDEPLSKGMLEDIDGLLCVLAPGSILIVTVDGEARIPNDEREDLLKEPEEEDIETYYASHFGHLVEGGIAKRDLALNEFPLLLSRIMRSYISDLLSAREGITFGQLFNFRYRDGRQMFTIGGIIEEDGCLEALRKSAIFDWQFIVQGEEPLTISVPPLTLREKQWLDQKIRSPDGAGPTAHRLAFELAPELLENYRKFYKHYPTFHEALL